MVVVVAGVGSLLAFFSPPPPQPLAMPPANAGGLTPATYASIVAFFASVVLALDVPPPPTQWVTDRADLLDASQEISLNTKLKNFEQQSGAQLIVYTFPSAASPFA